jgi:hypothetical protein
MTQTAIDWSERQQLLDDARERSIEKRFAEFHAANPDVYAELVTIVRRAKALGHKRLGIRMVWEVMRWDRLINPRPNTPDDFKLNDHFHSRYARLLMEREPDLAGVFELRELRA